MFFVFAASYGLAAFHGALPLCSLTVTVLMVLQGMEYTCTDTSVSNKAECIGTFVGTVHNFNSNLFAPCTTSNSLMFGMPLPRVWQLPDSNFNHIGSGFLALFKVLPSGAQHTCLLTSCT